MIASKNTKAIMLRRINYGEADRIITVLTPDYGKLTLMAKGVRKSTSKLAGGIELLSESDISFIKGKGDIDTLVSTRLVRHFGDIVKDLDRTSSAYDFLKKIDKTTEDDTSAEHYDLTARVLESLNDVRVALSITESWGLMRLMILHGASPNLEHDGEGQPFEETATYRYDFDSGVFFESPEGDISAEILKYLRLCMTHSPQFLAKITDVSTIAKTAASILATIYRYTNNLAA